MSTRRRSRKQPRRSHRAPAAARSASTAASSVSNTPEPAPPQLHQLINDTASLLLHSNLTPLQNPNPNIRMTTLPNGLRVSTESIPHSKTDSVCVWIDTGTRYETESTNGVARFLTFMLLRGTEKRSNDDVCLEVRSMGGQLCGATSFEMTLYFTNVKAGKAAKALDVFSDILQNSAFDDDMIELQRLVSLREYQQVMRTGDEVLFQALHATAFQGTPLARRMFGCPKTITSLTKKDMQDYLSTHYTTHRMVISVTGAIKHEDIVEQVDKLFTKLSTNPVTSAQLVEKEPAKFTASEIRKRNDNAHFAHFGIFFEGASRTDPDSIALRVIHNMLGSWTKGTDVGKDKSTLLAQMEGIDELVESVTPVRRVFKETGLFGVFASAIPERLDDLASAIMQEFSKLCYQVAEEDVIRAQNQFKTLYCEDQHSAAEIGEQMLCYGRKLPLAEMFAKIDAVDVATVKRVANRFMFDKDLAIVAYGAVKLLPDYNWFRSRTSMLPS